ncbi:UNVERIFIED_CONTAM: heme exporter protein D [Jeotgalibacillus campisalis]
MTEQAQVPARKKRNWGVKTILILVAVLVAVAAYFILGAVLPRWWSDVIAGQIRRDLGASVLVGMFYGSVFTFVPLLVAWQATRKAVSWPWKIALVLVAVAIATPNLLTAGIAFGSTESAHAGQRTLSMDAGFFTTWTAISAVAAVVVFIAVTILWALWRRRGKQMKVLRQAENQRVRAAKNAETQAQDITPSA